MWIKFSFLWNLFLNCFFWMLCTAAALHPIIRHYAKPNIVKECGNSVLYCEILSRDAKVWWTRNDSEINIVDPNIIVHEELENTTLWKFIISCAQLNDTGNYTCHVKTVNSSVHYSKSLFFRVTEPLSIKNHPLISGRLGERVLMNCTVIGSLLPSSIVWSKNGSHLESSNFINISHRVINASEITSSLEIRNLTNSYLGTYICLAVTEVDNITANTTVVLELLKPENITIKPVAGKKVKLKWWIGESHIPVDKYEIIVQSEDGSQRQIDVSVSHSLKPGHHTHEIEDLTPESTFKFQLRACSNKIGCGKFSESKEITLPGYSSPPLNVTLTCQYDNISRSNLIHAKWEPPLYPKGKIKHYMVILESQARYLNSEGNYSAVNNSNNSESLITSFKSPVSPNTNYTIKLCAFNDAGCGEFSDYTLDTMCSTPPNVPTTFPDFYLRRADSTEECRQLKLEMKRVDERHGPIKCYRVILYKMKNGKEVIPQADDIKISSYSEVHKDGGSGAYIAEAFDGDNFPMEVMLGDDSQSRCNEMTSRKHKRAISFDDEIQETVYDGELAADTFYTGFLEVKVIGKDDVILTKRSSRFDPIRTGYIKYSLQATALGVICGLLIVIIILAIALCALSRRNQFVDYDTDYRFCCVVCSPFRSLGRSGTAGTPVLPPPDIKPLKPENLPTAFIERHKDSDLLFQREFESLPEQFRDRTTRASDMLENFFKNRYPDIKAYDQTRVKLSTVDGIAGSDYINANYVMGYKERKKFICAQGPLERTVNDFWRMIWEQKIDIVVMVTCLEENGKTKCTKYWPEEDEKKYGNITVSLRESNTFSDYVLRKFTVYFKKDENNPESKDLLQFHYLTWRDFLAPEHPGGILKFIKRINEKYTPDKGPILIHCSAGVGRTGTLVVIDSLLQQMKEEGQVEIFNFVSNLRRQRNFLVQSLKQYIFIYRALMEFAQFGDTEIEIQELQAKCTLLGLEVKNGKSQLRTEFEKLSQVIEDLKTTDVATTDVHSSKNRISSVVPYDRNRVILTPVPSREHSSYINASFIQGYSRNASFIITQDPLEETVSEFWRMVHEQNSPLIIMLTQQPDPQYWPDDELEYDHIGVHLACSEELPFASKRTFNVTNNKNSKTHTAIHYHYCDWINEVPSSTEGFINLVKLVAELTTEDSGAVIVHCSEAGNRSAVFVTCCIILHQLMLEERVDIFQTVRNLRSQRLGLFQNFELYKFCYQIALELAKE